MRIRDLLCSYDSISDYLLLLSVASEAADLGLLTAYDPELKLHQTQNPMQVSTLDKRCHMHSCYVTCSCVDTATYIMRHQ